MPYIIVLTVMSVLPHATFTIIELIAATSLAWCIELARAWLTGFCKGYFDAPA